MGLLSVMPRMHVSRCSPKQCKALLVTCHLVNIPLQPLKKVQGSIEDDVSIISEAGSDVPLLNTAKDLGVVKDSVRSSDFLMLRS
jgi:hypothetical protein